MMANNNDWNQRLGKLNGQIYIDVRRILDSDHCWTLFTTILDGPYSLSEQKLQVFNRDPNRVEKLMLYLSSLNMTIQQFVDYAYQAQIGPILRHFGIIVPVRITQQPFPAWWDVTTGESLSLELRASGSPPPCYQWFKDNHPIPNANGNVLQIPSTCTRHSGFYVCQITNGVPGDPILQSTPVSISVSPARKLVIKEQPRSFTVNQNANTFLMCSVWGNVEVDYQWMRNGKEITDCDNISGSNTNELKLSNIQESGCYCCRISGGQEVLFTHDAVLQVDNIPSEVYTATDKVALLMGAGDYRSELSLKAPQYDIQTMATVFRSLNFKVVSLMNLTKKEMIAAIQEFKHLVGEGVYCVFYFCGHGFESSGQCYLLPPDAPQGYDHRHCLSADAILFNVLLPQLPKICCMILDICRLSREGKPELLKPPDAEYVMCYGTSQGSVAYEQNNSGILISHLKNILQSDLGVEEVFRRLRKEIKDDPILKDDEDGVQKKQAPEIRTNLSESNRSFHDKINPRGYTEAFTLRQNAWERAHWQPDSRDIVVNFPDFDVVVRLDFQAEFSNVLTVFTSVINAGPSKTCKARISGIPADVADKVKFVSIEEGTETSLCKNYVTFHDMQRLKAEMHIRILVVCTLHDNTDIKMTVTENLGLPLVSSLYLWKEYPNLTRCHEAEEADFF